jgi:hypothetical protein
MSTVLIENIHVQMQRTPAIARAVAEGAGETAVPLLLILLCILSVFIPAFIMAEPVHSLFVPLSISVGLAVITAYALSSTIVPVLSIWLLKPLGIGKPQRASAATTQLLNFTQPHSTNAFADEVVHGYYQAYLRPDADSTSLPLPRPAEVRPAARRRGRADHRLGRVPGTHLTRGRKTGPEHSVGLLTPSHAVGVACSLRRRSSDVAEFVSVPLPRLQRPESSPIPLEGRHPGIWLKAAQRAESHAMLAVW